MRLIDVVFVWHLQDVHQIAWHGRRHAHEAGLHEIHYFISGEGSFRNGKHVWTIRPGSLHLTVPGIIHQILATDPKRPITYYALLFDARDLPGAGTVGSPESGARRDLELEGLMERLAAVEKPWDIGTMRRFFFADILERHFSGREELGISARHQVMAFLWDLASGADRAMDSGDNANVEKALSIMQGAIDRGLDLSELASRVGLSREHFVRVFSSRMGMSPMRYFGRLRVEAARAMLSSTNLRINEISDRLRYSSQFNFARTFHRLAGMSPSEYRARCLQRADFTAETSAAAEAGGPGGG